MALNIRNRVARTFLNISEFIGGGPWDNSQVGSVPMLDVGSTFNPAGAVHTIPAAAASIRFLQAQVTRVQKRVASRGEFPEPHPTHWVNGLMRSPHPTITPAGLWAATTLDFYTRGCAFWRLRRSARNPERVIRIELVRLAGIRTGNIDSEDAVFDVYTTPRDAPGYYSVPVPQRDLCRFHDEEWHPLDNLGLPRTPLNPISGKAYQTLKLYGSLIRRYQNAQKNGLTSDLAVFLDPEHIEAWVERYKERGAGFEYANLPLVFETGADVKQLKSNDRDRQTVEIARFLIGEISRIYGVPLYVLQSDMQSGAGSRASRNEVSEQFNHFIAGPFSLVCQTFADEINLKLLGRSRQVDLIFDLELLALGSLETRANVANTLVQRTGVWTPDYARARLFGLGPVEGGDMLRVPTGGGGSFEGQGGGADDDDSVDSDDDDTGNMENGDQ